MALKDMKAAYAQAGKIGKEGSAKEEKTESKAEAKAEGDAPFISKKTGTSGTMVTCPECGAHFRTEYK